MPRSRAPVRPPAPPATPRRDRRRAQVDPAAVAAAYLTGGPDRARRHPVPTPEPEEEIPSGGIVDQQVYAPLEAPRTPLRAAQHEHPSRPPDPRPRSRRRR